MTDVSELYSGERHEIQSVSIGKDQQQKHNKTNSQPINPETRTATSEDALLQQQIKTRELQKTRDRIKDAFGHNKAARTESKILHRTSPPIDIVKLTSNVESGYNRFFRIPGEPPTPEKHNSEEKGPEEYKVFVLEDRETKEPSSSTLRGENTSRENSPANFDSKRHRMESTTKHHSSDNVTLPTRQIPPSNTSDDSLFIRPGVSVDSISKPIETNLYSSPAFNYNNRVSSKLNRPQEPFRMPPPVKFNIQSKYDIQQNHQERKDPQQEFIELDRKFDFVTDEEKAQSKDMVASMVNTHAEKMTLPDSPQKKKVRLSLNYQMAPKRKARKATAKSSTPRSMALTEDNPFSGPNKAAEEISRLVDIDKDVRAELTQEIKTLYWRIEEEKKYVCKLCEKTFERFSNLNAHVTMHLELKPYICKSCGSKYKLRSLLNDHIRLKHLKKSGYVNCQTCNGRFKLGSSYLKHRALCTNSLTAKQQDNPTNSHRNDLKEENAQ